MQIRTKKIAFFRATVPSILLKITIHLVERQ
jgi:hypothetical protein